MIDGRYLMTIKNHLLEGMIMKKEIYFMLNEIKVKVILTEVGYK